MNYVDLHNFKWNHDSFENLCMFRTCPGYVFFENASNIEKTYR